MNLASYIKAIAFDFDGTLIDFDYRASDYTRKALSLLEKSDYKISLSSGRPCFLALKAFQKTFGDYPLDYVFGCNGAEFMDVRKKQTKILYPLSSDDVRYIGKVIDSDFLSVGIYENETFLVDKIANEKVAKWIKARWLNPKIFDFSKNCIPRSKIVVLNDATDREKEDEYLKTIDLSAYNTCYSTMNCFEITLKGVTKAKSIEYLSQLLGCEKKQILSFGDMENDMEMLKESTGVIMGNADESLKKQIPFHTSRVDELGIYEFLANNHLI